MEIHEDLEGKKRGCGERKQKRKTSAHASGDRRKRVRAHAMPLKDKA